MPSVSVQDAVPSPAAEGERLERAVFEIKRVIVGQDRLVERMLVGLLARGHLLLEGVPGRGEDPRRRDGREGRRRHVRAPPVHPGPRALRHPRHPHLPAGPRGVRRRARPGRRQLRARRRDQPRAREGAVGDARGDGRAARLDRRRRPSRCPTRSSCSPRRTRSRTRASTRCPRPSATGSCSRSSSSTPAVEEEREIVYRMGVEPAGRRSRCWSPPSCRGCRPSPRRCSCTTRSSTTWCGSSWPPARPAEHGLADVAGWVAYGASPRATLGIVAAARALALVRGRDYVLPQDVLDVAPDVLRHRLVLSYDALADEVPIDHIVTRVLATVPLPQVTARPQAPPRRRSGAMRRPMNTAPPSLRGGTAGGRAQGARADGADPARRAAAGQPPRPRARPGLRAGRGPRLPARRRRAAHRLGGHRPHHRAARAPDRRRPRAGDVGGGGPLAQPRLRHRRLREARPRDRRARRRRAPHPGRRQPDRRARRHGRAARAPPRPRRPGARARAAPPGRAGAAARRGHPRRPHGGDRGAAPPAAAPRPRRRGLRLPRRPRLGAAAARRCPGATSCWPSRCSTRASWSCPTSAPSCWPTRSPGASARSSPRRCCAGSSPRRPPRTASGWRVALRRGGAAHLRLRTDRDWIADVVRFALTRKRAWSGGGPVNRRLHPALVARWACSWWRSLAVGLRRAAAPPPSRHDGVHQPRAARQDRAEAARLVPAHPGGRAARRAGPAHRGAGRARRPRRGCRATGPPSCS